MESESELTEQELQTARQELVKVMNTRALVHYLQHATATPKPTAWNVLFKKNPLDERIEHREYLSYEVAVRERDKILTRFNPVWTAVVRDRRARNASAEHSSTD